MPDIFTKKKRSAVMSAIRSRGNRTTELRLITVFRAQQIKGWRRGAVLKVAGEGAKQKMKFGVRPDFIFPARRLAVFVDGCFWHGCPSHYRRPGKNGEFWDAKIKRNRTRDLVVNRTLRGADWQVLRIWEHDLRRKNEQRLTGRLSRLFPTLQSNGVALRSDIRRGCA
jgi:DNA mismatch endonuclease (patch repair protein)